MKMIDFFTLQSSLKETVLFHRRRYGWAKRAHKRLSIIDSIHEETGDMLVGEAIDYIRLYLQVEANRLLRDFGENSVLINAENAPLTYQIFTNDQNLPPPGGEGGGE
jgi:hypothetical protein